MIILGTNSIKDAGGFNVANSCRFDGASSVMYVDTSSASTNKVTISAWIKRSKITADGFIITSYRDNSNRAKFGFGGADNLTYFMTEGGTDTEWNTTAKFRDTGAWMHVVAQLDNTQSTFANRCKLFVNGTEYATSSSGSSTQSSATAIIGNGTTSVGNSYYGGAYQGNWFGGYMAQVAMIQGVIHAPTDFGEFDEDSGIWKPIDVSGLTFGTNGFYLETKQSGTSQNSSGLGADTSGNDNHFAVNNLTAIDQSTDTCTNNFATLNPLDNFYAGSAFSEGNLKIVSGSNPYAANSATIGLSKGKWYWEIKVSSTSNEDMIGIRGDQTTSDADYLGSSAYDYAYNSANGKIYNSGSNSAYGATYGTNNIISIALDLDSSTNTITFYKDGASQGASNITNVSSTTFGLYFPSLSDFVGGGSGTYEANFGSPPYAISSGNTDGNGYGNFEYAVPSGYLALCTKNLGSSGG